jgi:hypothetical protein
MSAVPDPWREYRRRSRIAMFGLLGLPLAVVLGVAVGPIFGTSGLVVFIALALAWIVWWPWVAFRLVRWPCQRCGIPYLSYQDPWVRACSKCGPRLYADL